GLRQPDLVSHLVDRRVRGWGLGVLLRGVTEALELLHVEESRPELILQTLLRGSEARLTGSERGLVAKVVVPRWCLGVGHPEKGNGGDECPVQCGAAPGVPDYSAHGAPL